MKLMASLEARRDQLSAWRQRMLPPREPIIEFLCDPADDGVIAPPTPARNFMPAWLKHLPSVDKAEVGINNNGQTIKRCMPFLDAMRVGYVIPLAATVRLDIKDNGCTVSAGWDFDREMVSPHGVHQVAGSHLGGRPPMKFHNFWTVRTAPGWSTLFLPMINRPNDVFEVLSAVVDTDEYRARVNFPFFAKAEDGLHVVEKGTPLIQAIPFRRDTTMVDAVIRCETEADTLDRQRIHRNTLAGEGWYRLHARAER